MPLSPKAQENIASTEATRRTHLADIAKTLGVPSFELVVDFEELHENPQVNASKKNTLGAAAADYLKSLAAKVKDVAKKNPDYVVQIAKLVHKNQVLFTVGPTDDGGIYYQLKIVDGQFVFIIPPAKMWTNAGDAASKLQALVDSMSGGCPPQLKLQIQESESKRNELLTRISKVLKLERPYQLVCNYEAMYGEQGLEKHKRDKLVHAVNEYLAILVKRIEEMVQLSEMYIEEFHNHVHKNQIEFKFGSTTDGSTYCQLNVENGQISLVVPPRYFWTNVSDCASKLERIIDDLSGTPSKQSVKYRMSVDKAEEICPKILDRMSNITGQPYELLGIDWQQIWENNVPLIEVDKRNDLPETLIAIYLNSLVNAAHDFITDKYKHKNEVTFVAYDTPNPFGRFNRCFYANKIRIRFGPNLVHQYNDYYVNFGEMIAKSGEIVLSLQEKIIRVNETVFSSIANSTMTFEKIILREEEKWKKASGWMDPSCDLCDANVNASHYCTVCEKHLCYDHEAAHKKEKQTTDHKLIWALDRLTPVYTDTPLPNCGICDEEEQATHYCPTCEEYICTFHAGMHKKERKTKTHELKSASGADLTETEIADDSRSSDTVTASVSSISISSSSCKLSREDLSKIHGKIKIVDAFPDYKVQVVTAFPHMKVKKVSNFANKPGLWQIVDAFPDYKIQIVNAFPDFKIQYVSAFPGVNIK